MDRTLEQLSPYDHSIPYLVAVALHDGAVTPASFTDERVRDPALRPLMAKMTLAEDDAFTQRFPQEVNCRAGLAGKARSYGKSGRL